MQNSDLNPPSPKRFKLLTWYRGVAFLLFLPCFLFIFFMPDRQTPLIYYMFPAILWAGLVAQRLDGAYLWKKKTPRQCYKMARYQRVFSIPFFAALGTLMLLMRSAIFSAPITPFNWVLMISILSITTGVLITSQKTCRQLRRQFIDAAHLWRRCYECGYDLRASEAGHCPECGYTHEAEQPNKN